MIESRYECVISVQQEPNRNLFTNPTAEISLADAASAGLASFQRTTGSANLNARTQTGFRLNGSASTNDSYMTVVAGEPIENEALYTVSGEFFISAAMTGTAHARARRIVVLHRIGAAAYTEVTSAQAANVAGNTRLSVPFLLPAGTTEVLIRFYHGHASTATAFWHSLRLAPVSGTGLLDDYLDGGMPGSIDMAGLEYGWDGQPGLSMSRRVNRADNIVLQDAEFDQISYDLRRVPHVMADITARMPDLGVLPLLDPERLYDPILNYRIEHYTRGVGGELDQLVSSAPVGSSVADAAGKLWLRDLEINWVNNRIGIRATSGEARFEDKKRAAVTVLDTGATTGEALFRFAAGDVGEATAIESIDPGATALAIPAGNRRLWMQGEPASSLFEAELAAIGLRAFCSDVGRFQVSEFVKPPGYFTLIGITIKDGDDGTIYGFTETSSRDDWRDATLVKAQYVDGAGVQQTAYQAYASATLSRKSDVAPIGRAIPSSTYAQTVTTRAQQRVRTHRLTAGLSFEVRVGRIFNATVGGTTTTIMPEKITYRPALGVMVIEGYVHIP